MIRALDRKLLRDLMHLKGQLVAIVVLVLCAVTLFVGSMSLQAALERSQRDFYETHRFPEIFATVRRAPESVVSAIREIPQLAEIETRVVAGVPLEIPGFEESATAWLVSIPSGEQPVLGQLYVRSGRLARAGTSPWEVVIGEAMFVAQKLRLGDELHMVVNGRRQAVRIVGVATTPQFIYQVRPGDVMPDDKRYGVFWVPRDELAPAMDLEGSFNDVVATLTPDASEADAIAALDRVLAPWGGIGAGGRDRQVAHRFFSDEIRQQRASAVITPAIFLAVASFLLNVLLTRLIATQTEQIATLKALGYTDASVGWHYAKLAALAAVVGSTLGTVLGFWYGSGMIEIYADFYRLPRYDYRIEAWVALASLALGLASALLGVRSAVLRAVRLPPAEAMRPRAPADFHPSLLERTGIGRLLSTAGRMVLRNLARRPWRAVLSSVGISFSVAILVSGWFFFDSMDYIVDLQFRRVRRDDLAVSFLESRSRDALLELRRVPGVLSAEPVREVAATLRAGHRSYLLGLTGLEPGSVLRRVVGPGDRVYEVPPEGVLLTRELARRLDVQPGDRLSIEVMEGARPVREVRVAALSEELLGVSAVMDLGALGRMMGDGERLSGAMLQVDPARAGDIHRQLRHMPGVLGVASKEAGVKSWTELTAKMTLVFAFFLVLFASAIAVGVAYNAARVSLAERERELATLRVIGFTRGEVARVLLGELGTIAVLGLAPGCWLGWLFATAIVQGTNSELFRIPVIITTKTYGFAVLVVLGACLVVGLAMRRRLDRLDLVGVLKTRE